MNPVEKVVFNRLTTKETVDALALFLDNVPFKSNNYWPKGFHVEITQVSSICHRTVFKITRSANNLYVASVAITGYKSHREVSVLSNTESGLTVKEEFDYVKTALRRMVIAVAYRDFSIEKKIKEDRKKQFLAFGPGEE